MSASPWPSNPADPRRAVRVGRARVDVGVRARGDDGGTSALIWQQRIEDALRCAHFGVGQRLVLLRKLQVNAGSIAAPGWAGVVEAAAQDAVARACNGRSAGAEQSPAVWFESWDDAVAAWLDAALRWPAQRVSPHAWFWSRIARMAGVARPVASRASPDTTRVNAIDSLVLEQARAMLACWQADPASQRACSEWLAQRPACRAWLLPQEAASVAARAEASGANDAKGVVERALSRPELTRAEDDATASTAARADAQAASPRVDDSLAAGVEPTIARPSRDTNRSASQASHAGEGRVAQDALRTEPEQSERTASDTDRHAAQPPTELHARHAAAQMDEPAATRRDADLASPMPQEAEPRDAPAVPRDARDAAARSHTTPAAEPVVSALGWTHLRRTQLGGLPLTLNALQRLGFADALNAPWLDGCDPLFAASAPWLAVWASLRPQARQRWVRDPMFAVLPAFDAVAALPSHEWADALLASWRAQPAAVHQWGRQTWRRLQRTARAHGWRSPRAWLQRPAWMQLDATHLDVIFALDQADLSVRRLGLDADPGWVPWLGRIVSLHFEPADQLPAWSTP